MAGRKPIAQCTASEWRAATRRIRCAIPAPEGYAWRFVWSASLRDCRGDCDRRPGKAGRLGTITIRIARGMSESETAETLIHEVAHAFDMWTHHGWAGDHSDTWGVWYARVHRRYWGLETG